MPLDYMWGQELRKSTQSLHPQKTQAPLPPTVYSENPSTVSMNEKDARPGALESGPGPLPYALGAQVFGYEM